MKHIFQDLLFGYEKSEEKISEKTLISHLAKSVVMILICMAAMSFTAYAYFSHSEGTMVNVITPANWEIDVVPPADAAQNGDWYIVKNESGDTKEYSFTVREHTTETSATVGFVTVALRTDLDGFAADQLYYSKPLGTFLEGGVLVEKTEREIKFSVPGGKELRVKFIGEWGSCSAPDEKILGETALNPAFAALVMTPPPASSGTEQASPATTATTTTTTTTVTTTKTTVTTTKKPSETTTVTTTTAAAVTTAKPSETEEQTTTEN